MSVITIPKVLRDKLGDDGVEAFASVMREVEKESRQELATKADFKELEGEVKLLKWMVGFVIAMNIGIILMLLKVLTK